MDKAKSITKSGWHPKGKDGGKESWRGDFKGINQVAGWVGKGKTPSSAQAAQEHTSRPLSTLKDPDTFGPPPKKVNYPGGTAGPNTATPDRRGLGAPLTAEEIQAKNNDVRRQEEAARKSAPPPVPYRADRTGISMQSLPKPPTRAAAIDGDGIGGNPVTKLKPKLPPRLPPRQNSHPGVNASSPPPPYTAATQGSQDGSIEPVAVGGLGQAGVSVPGLGIGHTSSPSQQQQETNPWRDPGSSATPSSNPSGLQSRLSSLMGNSASPTTQSPFSPPPAHGTTWQEKQAALKTASTFRNDPSSISMADAKATASTANNFRERHGEQVAQGWKVGNGLNEKYGIVEKANSYGGNTSGAGTGASLPTPSENVTASPAAGGGGLGQAAAIFGGFKKAPPPPPTSRITGGAGSPPPVPLNSKPK
ncbi:MAG: hypothetical protein Q9217_001408 [Psora testacea]